MTIPVTATLHVPTNKTRSSTAADTSRSTARHVQIMKLRQPGLCKPTSTGLTLQHIAFVNGKTTPTGAIPTAPAPCSQGWNDGQGGALYMRDGNLTVIDCIFTGNQAAPLGPDTGGGAIYVQGSKHGA